MEFVASSRQSRRLPQGVRQGVYQLACCICLVFGSSSEQHHSSVSVSNCAVSSHCPFLMLMSHLLFSIPPPSPRTQSSLVRLSGDSGGCSSPLANGFITKEIFDTHRPSKPAPGKTRDSGDKESFSRNPRKDSPDPFLSKRPAPLQLQGEAIQSTQLPTGKTCGFCWKLD